MSTASGSGSDIEAEEVPCDTEALADVESAIGFGESLDKVGFDLSKDVVAVGFEVSMVFCSAAGVATRVDEDSVDIGALMHVDSTGFGVSLGNVTVGFEVSLDTDTIGFVALILSGTGSFGVSRSDELPIGFVAVGFKVASFVLGPSFVFGASIGLAASIDFTISLSSPNLSPSIIGLLRATGAGAFAKATLVDALESSEFGTETVRGILIGRSVANGGKAVEVIEL